MRVKTRITSIALATGQILTFGQMAWPQSSLYFDRNDFLNAAIAVPGNFVTISSFPLANGPELTIADLTFRGRYLVGGPVLWNFDGSDPGLNIHFAAGARAFGADFSSALSAHGYSSFTATVLLNTGETFQFTAPTDPNFAFFGFISPTPIMEMTFSDGGLIGTGLHEEVLDNITVVQVPEPSMFGLMALGALLLGLRWRKFWPSK